MKTSSHPKILYKRLDMLSQVVKIKTLT